MTDKEKARAYDEALTTAKRIISKNCSEVEKLCLKCVFPELAESEDERVRKWLVDYFKKVGKSWIHRDISPEQILAYLEKQKKLFESGRGLYYYDGEKTTYCGYPATEQKDYRKLYEGVTKSDWFKKSYVGKSLGEERPTNSEIPKESKPEWSKNDTAFLNEITDFFESKTVRLQHDLDMYAHWLKSLPERFNLQPKQEWSEEDEEKINNISEIIEHCIAIPYSGGTLKLSQEYKKELQCFLKSLRPVSKESLQPHWKPSEEQMNAVKHAYNSFPNDCPTKSNLRFLYHDLEKLGVREEPEYYQHFDPDC